MSLQLDTRQRAMLAEMGVRVWWPQVQADASQPAQALTVQVAASDVAQTPAHAPDSVAQQPTVSQPKSNVMPTVARVLETVLPVSAPAPTHVQPMPALTQLDWAALRDAAQHCQACELCQTRQQTVFGAGAHSEEQLQVDWLVVAESPNEEEQARAQPFVGDTGVLLDNMLKACGLSRSVQTGMGRVFVTHVTKCSPPGGRNARPEELAQCRAYLLRQIELLRPRMILALGRLSANALLQDSVPDVQALALGKLRGQVHQCGDTPVVVTFHPAYVMRNLTEKAKVWADLCLAMAHLK